MFTIIFDLDGTLVDTAPDLIDALNFTLKQHRMPDFPYEEARRLIGGGMRAMLEGAMVVEVVARRRPASTRFMFIAHRSRPFPGRCRRSSIAWLRRAIGSRYALNKLQWLSRRLIDA